MQIRRSSSAPSHFDERDAHFFREGTHARLYDKLGAQLAAEGAATRFAVWAPNAVAVSVIGDWNGWDPQADPMQPLPDGIGIWAAELPEVRHGERYKYRIAGRDGSQVDKADPFAACTELPPASASRVWALDYDWGDAAWLAARRQQPLLESPLSIYELHIGSWRRPGGRWLGYRDLAHAVADYVREMGFSHVELMPATEHPFYGSWGYQTTGYFAPSARWGTPQDFMYLIDYLHQQGIGVILDWVPSHFPNDEFGLYRFDGTHLYEHADPRQGFHPEWNSSIFNYGRYEVRSFLLSSALFWLDRYHVDGLRVDAVASMLYLDYARKPGEWVPNRHGGHENLEAVDFLRLLNQTVHRELPGTFTVAEESTAWPGVSRPVSEGGLGFDLKWNMGWMHDTLSYFGKPPVYRRYHQDELTFSLVYAHHENFVLPFSHDEVVHGKGSLLARMPGDVWQQFANLRALFGYMWTHPGKKLLFMGGEFAQRREWTHEGELQWHLLEHGPHHRGVRQLICDLNRLYLQEPALHQLDMSPAGFEWVANDDAQASVIAYLRLPRSGGAPLLVVCNLTPVPREGYVLGVPLPGRWTELFNSDAGDYGGSGWGNLGGVDARAEPAHGRPCSVSLVLPPLATLILRGEAGNGQV